MRSLIDAVERPLQSLEHAVDIGGVADHARSRGDPGAVEMVGDLGAHHFGLLGHLRRERAFMRARFVADHAERRLERVREIADMGARPVDDLAIGLDQLVQLLLQRPDLVRQLAFELLGVARADRGEILADAAERLQPEADLEKGRSQEPEPEHAERSDEEHG